MSGNRTYINLDIIANINENFKLSCLKVSETNCIIQDEMNALEETEYDKQEFIDGKERFQIYLSYINAVKSKEEIIVKNNDAIIEGIREILSVTLENL